MQASGGSAYWPGRHAALLRTFVARDVAARYRQSWLGMAWLVLTPLLMLAVYTLVFRQVFQVRWGGADEGVLVFALRLYAGLAVFNYFAECVNRAPHLVLEQPHLVKKVVFPVELLAWSSAIAALLPLAVAGALLLVLRTWGMGTLPASALALPLVWLPLLPLCVGLGWIFSAVGTYVRDLPQILGMAMTALVFLSPVFFPVEALPRPLQPWMALNPLAPVMTQTRTVLLQGQWPDLLSWTGSMATGLVLMVLGAWTFRRVRPGFADVV